MHAIPLIVSPDKAAAQRRRDYERQARRLAQQFWSEPTSFVPNVRQALERAYIQGREDQAFGRRDA
jgi:hypothetical protein